MKDQNTAGLRGRVNSFRYAFSGIAQLLRQEPNMRIHAVASVAVIIAGFVQEISRGQWLGIIFAICLVWVTEAVNTSIEMLCNLVVDNKFHPMVKIIKDISAGAVLLAAIASLFIAGVVFF